MRRKIEKEKIKNFSGKEIQKKIICKWQGKQRKFVKWKLRKLPKRKWKSGKKRGGRRKKVSVKS